MEGAVVTTGNAPWPLNEAKRDTAFATLRDRPVFGMVTNGASYLFVKLMGAEYGVSDLFGTRSQHRNNLVEVLEILRCFGQLVTM